MKPRAYFLAALAAPAFAATLAAAPAPLQPLLDATPPGGTLRLAPGSYAGPATIKRPLTLDGGRQAVIMGDGNSTVLSVATNGVTLRGLRVTGSGDSHDRVDAGILLEGDDHRVEDNEIDDVLFGIHLKRVNRSRIAGNRVTGKALSLAMRGDGGGPQFFKPTGANAKAANQAASYTLGELRRWRSEKTYSSNLDLNVKTGIMKWTAAEPFFVAQECIVAKAGRDTEGWADLLADAIEGMISVETMEPCEAAARPWKSRAAHQSFADEYFAAMAFERERVCSAIEETALRVKLDGDGSHAILRSEDAAPPGIIL